MDLCLLSAALAWLGLGFRSRVRLGLANPNPNHVQGGVRLGVQPQCRLEEGGASTMRGVGVDNAQTDVNIKLQP